MISSYVSVVLTLRNGACLVEINSDSKKERENVADTESGRTRWRSSPGGRRGWEVQEVMGGREGAEEWSVRREEKGYLEN